MHEGVVDESVSDALAVELSRQPVVSVEVKLQAEGAPGRHPQVAEPELFVDEVEVVVQAFAAGGLEKGLVGFLVVPRLVGVARLHRRENVDESRMIAALFDEGLDAFFLADILLADEVDLEVVVRRQLFGRCANFIP